MAENWDAYTRTIWTPGMPITKGNMDNIELGIESNRDDVKSLKTSISGLQTQVEAK